MDGTSGGRVRKQMDYQTKNGHLLFGGCDTVELAREFGTPLYVLDEEMLVENCQSFLRSMEKYYNGRGMVAFAGKSLCCLEVFRIMKREGMALDVVSGGELYTAAKAGFPMEKVFFHGNNKTPQEIRMALEYGVGHIVADNPVELALLEDISAELGKTAKVLFRIKPGVEAHTHQYIQTGQIDSKFGFALENGEAIRAVEQAKTLSHVKLCGLHCHIGSQIFGTEPFREAARIMLRFMKEAGELLGAPLHILNLGGGFGIRYTDDDEPIPYIEYMADVSQTVRETCGALGLDMPEIVIEPGRSVCGPAGITLYTVGNVKTIENVRTYVSVDGGMTDNPRYALYQAPYTALVANQADRPADFTATIAGRCCESGDLIQEHTLIQRPAPGDILAVLCTGAYNYSMASHYNRVLNPAMVLVNGGSARLIVKRESYEDLLKNDL